MKLTIKPLNIVTGGTFEAEMNTADAAKLDIHPGDRIEIRKGKRTTTAIVEITPSRKYTPEGTIRTCHELTEGFSLKTDDVVAIHPAPRPESVTYIKKKLRGERLSQNEIKTIIMDIANLKLSQIETTYFVSACYMHELNMEETVDLTKAMVNTGTRFRLKDKYVMDKHCIGGVAGNRTTILAVPIIAAAGLKIPKTSSRAITSPAGTADTMEVFCDVDFKVSKMKRILKKVGGCVVWGGGRLGLAPADDKIIRVEHPVALDPTGQLLASIIAKKASVSSNHLLIDIPVGEGSKMSDMKKAVILRKKFLELTKRMHIKAKVIFTDGRTPIGRGIGPVLEARDIMYVLLNDPKAPPELLDKATKLAGIMLEMAKKAKPGKGKMMAESLIRSGAALKKFNQIITAQGRHIDSIDDLVPARHIFAYKAKKSGKIRKIHNRLVAKLARIAGAPQDKAAGLYLHKTLNDNVKKGDTLLTIYSNSTEKLRYAKNLINEWKNGFVIR